MREPGTRVLGSLRQRWWLVAATPLATALLAGVFLFFVTPRFEAATTIRVIEDEGPLGGAVASGAQSGGGLSVLASLAGRGVPLQTELAVLSSRGLTERVVELLGLRLQLLQPTRVPRSQVLAQVELPLDGPEGTVYLRRQSDGSFLVRAHLLTTRDPFRLVRRERFAETVLGSVRPGAVLPLDGARIVLATEAAELDRIVFRLLSRDRALRVVEEGLSVSRPQREADVIRVALTWPDPVLAAEGANGLVEAYLAYREEARVGKAKRTSTFLKVQLDSLQAELRAAEERLRRFREEQNLVAPEAQVSAEVTRLSELKGRRDLLLAERDALRHMMAELADTTEKGASQRRIVFFPTLLQSQAIAELLRLLGELENERARMLDRRTPEARDVQLMDVRIRQIALELRTVAETYLQGLNRQVEALDATLTGFEQEMERVPGAELEYLRLRRHVELLTELVVFLQARQKEAEMDADKIGVGAQVLSRARPPEEPSTPRAALTMLLALLVGSLLGVVGAVTLDQVAARTVRA